MRTDLVLILALLICLVIPSSVSAQWCGTQTLYFTHSHMPDIPGYETLRNYPAGSAEDIENVTVRSALGNVLIDNYISDPGDPGVTNLLSGLRRYRVYAYVSGNSGTTTLNFTAFKRDISGGETNIYSVVTEDINDLSVAEQLVSYVSLSNITLNATDRWGVRVYGATTHPSNIQLYWVYEGSVHTSHVESGYYVCPPPPTGSSDSGGDASGAAFGLVGGLIGAVLAVNYLKEKKE